MKKIEFLRIGLLASVPILTGCASVVSKSNWPVNFKSNLPGAEITIKDKPGEEIDSGITPVTFALKSSSGFFQGATYYVEFRSSDHQVVKTSLNSQLNGWYLGNVLLGGFGLIGGLIIDPATGAMYKLPPTLTVNFDKSESTNSVHTDVPVTNSPKKQLNVK